MNHVLRSRFAAAALSVAVFLCIASVVRADDYSTDPTHSFVVFRVRHLGAGYVWGTFASPTGPIAYDANDPTKASFDVAVKADTIDTRNENRDKDLKGPDFFDVKQYATLNFKSKSVAKTGDNMLAVTGDLTLHGVTKEVTVNMEVTGTGKGMAGETRTGFETTFTIDRRDFKMSGDPAPIIGDEIRITVALEAVGQ